MLSGNDTEALMGSTVQDSAGDKVGKVGQVYLDDNSGSPEWVTVSTGLFGSKETFVPLAQASFADGILTVPVAKDSVKDAPQIDHDGHLSPEQEAELYRHYGLQYDESVDTRADNAGVDGADTVKARLRKYVTTETQTVQVPVSREEVRLEREPITDANRDQAMAGADLTEEEHEVTLTEERVVVGKETVPVERVRMDTETVRDTQEVSEEVRSEQIEVDGDINSGDTNSRDDTDLGDVRR